MILFVAGAQEVGVGVGLVALDDDVVALRHGLEHLAGLHAADLDVVEGEVQGLGIFDQAVVGDHRHAGRESRSATAGLMAVPS